MRSRARLRHCDCDTSLQLPPPASREEARKLQRRGGLPTETRGGSAPATLASSKKYETCNDATQALHECEYSIFMRLAACDAPLPGKVPTLAQGG